MVKVQVGITDCSKQVEKGVEKGVRAAPAAQRACSTGEGTQ